MTWQTFGTLVMIFILGTVGQDITFRDDSSEVSWTGSKNAPTTQQVPNNSKVQCPPNMLLYPGDGNRSIWECDCKPGFLYFPQTESCYEAYKQGPCPVQHYIILPVGEVLPKCERNPCTAEEGLVPYNNGCYKLKNIGEPCASTERLSVNETTFQLECVQIDISPFLLITVPSNRCPNGSRRNSIGQCRVTI